MKWFAGSSAKLERAYGKMALSLPLGEVYGGSEKGAGRHFLIPLSTFQQTAFKIHERQSRWGAFSSYRITAPVCAPFSSYKTRAEGPRVGRMELVQRGTCK